MTPNPHRGQLYPLAQTFLPHRAISLIRGLLLILAVILGSHSFAQAHGGKTHTDDGIAAFEALQTALDLYDRLLTHGKLDESWETGLVRVEITPPVSADNGGYTIQFQRSSGDPGSVYFFLTPAGEYAGSNFTGP